MGNHLISLLAALAVAYICRRYLRSKSGRGRLPFPPGPKPRLLVGNASIFQREKVAHVCEWAKPTKVCWRRSPREALGEHIIILNSLSDAVEIMEKRSSIYSSRPFVPMFELMDNNATSLLPYGDLWQSHRRIFQQSFRKDAAVLYEPIQKDKVRQMLRGLLEDPDNLHMHTRTLAAAIILSIVYGHNISTMNDRFVLIAEEVASRAVKAMLPGATLVNTIPALRHIPPWFPGVRFHQMAQKVRSLIHEMENATFDMVRKHMRDGTGEPSLLRSLLETNDADGGSIEHEAILKNVSVSAYGAGADTTASSVGTFFYAMATNPGAQRKAQEEIDAVIGNDRLPELRDRPSLPYVEAVYREVMRWRPVLPLGFPHTSTDDDVYKGFSIPKGSTIIPNIWAMTHDEKVYKDPDSFQPERYFEDGKLNNDDTVLAFGFGRRACVGRHLASSSVWLAMASVLATLNIGKAKDAQGSDIEIEGKYSDGLVSHPDPFPCSVTPRSLKSHELIDFDE
ncbi:cytochrome P450 [Infundibulicybe gibba]|nr:cytochrome P450 [Infundibulicybe gibba]